MSHLIIFVVPRKNDTTTTTISIILDDEGNMIEIPTKQAHEQTTREVSKTEYDAIKTQSQVINSALGYDTI